MCVNDTNSQNDHGFKAKLAPRVPYPGARGLLRRYESGDMNATSWFRTVAAGSRFSSPPKRQLQNKVLVVFVASLAWTAAASARQHAIDSGKSVMTVRVYKAGVFSALGHEHEIAAPITDGVVDSAAHYVELHIKAGSLRVHDPNTSERDRDEIQKTMLGSDVLDLEHYTRSSSGPLVSSWPALIPGKYAVI
jgi:hypothetical protein